MPPASLTDALRETLSLFDPSGPPLTTNEVAERLDLGRRSTYDRLDRLSEWDELETKKVGANARVWWRPGPASSVPALAHVEGDGETGQRQFALLVEAVEEYAIFMLDASGRVKTWNRGAERIKGYDREEIVGEHFSTFYTEAAREAAVPEDNLAKASAEGVATDEGWRVRADGSTFWAHVTITALYDDAGDLLGYAKVTRDMTDRREHERAIQHERNLLERVLETSPIGIGVFRDDGSVERVNARMSELLWLSEDEAEAYELGDLDLYGPSGDLLSYAQSPVGRVLEEGEPVSDQEVSIEDSDRGKRWLSVDATPLPGDDDDVRRVVATVTDVTQRKEQARRLERQRDDLASELEEMYERIDDAFYALDDEFRFTYVNERAGELLDAREAELVGESVWEVFEEAAETPVWDAFYRAMETQEPTGYEVYRESLGFWVEANVYPSETGLSVYFRDVTERKEREQELERYEHIVETMVDGVFVTNADGRYEMVNDAYVGMTGYSREELIGAETSLVIGEENAEEGREMVEEILDGERKVGIWELTQQRADGGTNVVESRFTILPNDGEYRGSVGVVRDVTERKERERQLGEYERIVETVGDGIYMVDEDLRIQLVNDAYEEITGYDREELLGAHISKVVDTEVVDFTRERREGMLDGEPGGTAEVPIETGSGESKTVQARYAPLFDDDEFRGTVGVIRDVSEQKERERQLERYERIVETVDDGVYLVDTEGCFTMVNEAYASMTGHSREELVGASVRDLVDDETVELARTYEQELIAGDRETARFEADVRTADGDSFRGEGVFSVIEVEDGEHERVGVVRDITERKERERELEARVTQQEVVTELSRKALADADLDDLMAEAAEAVAATLDNDYCKVLDLDPDSEELLLRQGVGWQDGVVGSETVSAVEDDSQAAYTLASEEPVVVSDLSAESRFSGPDLLTDHDVRSGVSTIIGQGDDPWGILGTHDRSPKTFSEQDVNFVQSVANILATAIDRRDYEDRLVLQGERLAALDDLNDVVRTITAAVIDQSTREEIERVVCEGLASTGSYEFAWIGDVDPQTQELRLRTEAGVEGYLDDITISADPDDSRSEGPTARAVLTGEMQTIADVVEDVAYEHWRDRAREYGFRSMAAIPVVHEGVRYGVVTVYADRPNAFTGDERDVIEHLGEIVGHAIAAVERKRALTSDEVVELTFQVPGVFDAFGLPAADGRLALEQSVPIGDGNYLVYGSANGDMLEVLDAAVETIPHWVAVRAIRDPRDDDVARFELRLEDPPVLSAVTAIGGYVDQAVIEDGDYHMRIHLAPSADVRQLIEVVREAYPVAQLISRQQVSRASASPVQLLGRIADELTDRQMSTLEAAYYAGYFEWPREVNGEEVAESFGISAPTFHQHLRNAQRKVFQVVLEDPAAV